MTLVRRVTYVLWILFCVSELSFGAASVSKTTNAQQDTIKDGQGELKRLGREAIDSLVEGKLEGQARNSKFVELYQRSFDQQKIASIMLGKYWNKMNDAQKQRFLNVQPHRLANMFSAKFKEYHGVDFKVGRGWINDATQKTLVITSTISKQGGKPLKVNWYLTPEYKIYNIVVEDISMVITFKQEYLRALREQTIEDFLAELEKIANQ